MEKKSDMNSIPIKIKTNSDEKRDIENDLINEDFGKVLQEMFAFVSQENNEKWKKIKSLKSCNLVIGGEEKLDVEMEEMPIEKIPKCVWEDELTNDGESSNGGKSFNLTKTWSYGFEESSRENSKHGWEDKLNNEGNTLTLTTWPDEFKKLNKLE
jgi:hypothetical protein